MDFREATDALFQRLDQEKLAQALGVSIASIRQARLRPEAAAHRSPPPNWRKAVIKLAEEQERIYRHLLEHLRTEIAH
jgi:DNA-binding GntR family transcriptional regulator